MLTGEKVVVLECGHSCHHDCLLELIDTTMPLVLENFDVVMPRCSTCSEPGIPLDHSLHLDILKKKLLSLPATPIDVYDSFPLKSPKWKLAHKLSTISARSCSSVDSEKSHSHSHKSQYSMSSVESTDPKLNESTHVVQEISLAIPNRILECRARTIAPPIVDISPEVDTVVAKSTYITGSKGPKDIYVTSAVTVQIPSDNQQLSPTTRNSSPFMQDPKLLKRIKDYIQESVADWKNLDFSLLGNIRLCDQFYISQDQSHWQKLDCYLFETNLVFVRRYPDRPPQLRGSVAIRDHLKSLTLPSTGSRRSHTLSLKLSKSNLQTLHLKTSDSVALENWYFALMDWTSTFPIHRMLPPNDPVAQRIAGCEGKLSRLPTSTHMPTDTVILVPLSGSPNGSKFPAIRNTILSVMREMTLFDRVSIVPYGSGGQQYLYGLAYNTWKPWRKVVDSLKPTGSAGNRADLLNGINSALSVLRDRTTRNPVSSILIISDSLSEITEASSEAIGMYASAENAKVHAFGISNHHSADTLDYVSSNGGGNYFYLRKWDELYQSVVGLFRSIQSYTHCNVSLSLNTTAGVSIVGLAGHNPSMTQGHNGRMSRRTPASPSSYTTEKVVSLVHLVELGDLTASEQRTFLVQVRVSGDALPLEISGKYPSAPFELFTSTLAFSSFAGPAEECLYRDEFFIPSGGASVTIESLNAFIQDLIESPISTRHENALISGGEPMYSGGQGNSSSSSVYTSNSLPPSPVGSFLGGRRESSQWYAEDVSPSPSIVYGDLMAAGEDPLTTPMYLSLEKYDIRVVQRRIQLTAINILEYVVRVDLREKNIEQVIRSVNSARAIITGLRACANTKSNGERKSCQGGRKQSDEEKDEQRAISMEVMQLVEILDEMLVTTSEQIREVNSFEEDYRKLLIQNVGILRNEKGFTLRTPLEAMFLQRQHVNNVI